MKRITPVQKKIADAHIAAHLAKTFSDPVVKDTPQLLDALTSGETFSELYNQIEIRYTSVTGMLMSSPNFFGHLSVNYKSGIYNGFKTFLNQHNIK